MAVCVLRVVGFVGLYTSQGCCLLRMASAPDHISAPSFSKSILEGGSPRIIAGTTSQLTLESLSSPLFGLFGAFGAGTRLVGSGLASSHAHGTSDCPNPNPQVDKCTKSSARKHRADTSVFESRKLGCSSLY